MKDDDASKHVGPDRSSPYPVSRLSGPVSLVDAAREIERADQWIASHGSAKLEQIALQMKALREQAEAVLAEARRDAELHRAEARFARHPGKTYHLYERAPGQRYWSMLSPHDWGASAPHGYLGSYRLESDQSWTPLERVAQRDQERRPLQDWLARGLSETGPSSPALFASGTAEAPMRAAKPHDAASTEQTEQKDSACESSSSLPSDPTAPA